ncbi:MAG: primosomal protein N' [SAR324 cluster bacterium]|nr:primosomal protein N' [SAR324 cluster bacterium]
MIVEIALNLPLLRTFDYVWPERLNSAPQLGIRVLVPFGSQKKSGVLVKIKEISDIPNLKEVENFLDDSPVFSSELLDLSRWVSEYYYCGWGEVLNSAIPNGLGIRLHTVFNRIVECQNLTGFNSLSSNFSNLVKTHGSWSKKDLFSIQATANDQKRMTQWINDKMVLRVQSLAGTKVKPKTERWVRLVGSPPPINKNHRRRSKKDKIFSLLREQTEISFSELKNYVPSPAQVIKNLEENQFVEVFRKRVYRRFLPNRIPDPEPFLSLSFDQDRAYHSIVESIIQESFKTFLLHGVTGSGKTEIYLHAVRKSLERGKQCLILVPEISLTPQLVNRFRSRFGDRIAVLHSGMEDGERFDEWSKILQQDVSIAIGARSAVYAPLENIGLIIVDEEHDSSYKQEDSPRYHGRDVAIYRAFCSGATVILGSATPSLESIYNVTKEKYYYLALPSRIPGAVLPEITLLDLKHCQRQKGSYFFSVQLIEGIRQRLLRREQCLLFLNRRGYANLIQCQVCEEVLVCPNCSLSLVYHQSLGSLQCHQCGYISALVRRCPHCSESALKILGVGTEQIESELKTIFPEAKIMRMDRDTLSRKHSLLKMLDQIGNNKVDIVVGTQLVTKGHDFSNITLVGVILADLSLNFPDFRSAEKTFQLLTQVAGRAGRGDKHGEVLIQTYNPQHHSIQCTQTQNYEEFHKIELGYRKQLNTPPYINLVLITFSSPKELRARSLATQFDANLSHADEINFYQMGPLEAPIKKISKRFRWMIILKADRIKLLHALLNKAMHSPKPISKGPADRISIDINPYSFL